jgi:hypothetical protein
MAGLHEDLDDTDEFYDASGFPPPTPEEISEVEKYLAHKKELLSVKTFHAKDNPYRYPQAIPGTAKLKPGYGGKRTVEIQCLFPGCPNRRQIFVADLFQCDTCVTHRRMVMRYGRWKRAQHMQAMERDLRPLPESVSNVPVTEELGGTRPAHILIKAKHDLSWVEYVDAEGNSKYMQIHDVRSARDAFGRWAIYGVDQNGEPVHELYDLRHGYEHSGSFSGVRELMYGEIVKLVQQGVIRGEDGKPIKTLSGLMQVADEPLRKLIMKKAKEAKAGGPSLEDIEKQMFAEPTASSAQKRRTGKAGTRPWQSISM